MPNIFATFQKSGIILLLATDKQIILFELSVSFKSNIDKAHGSKNK